MSITPVGTGRPVGPAVPASIVACTAIAFQSETASADAMLAETAIVITKHAIDDILLTLTIDLIPSSVKLVGRTLMASAELRVLSLCIDRERLPLVVRFDGRENVFALRRDGTTMSRTSRSRTDSRFSNDAKLAEGSGSRHCIYLPFIFLFVFCKRL